MLHRIDDYWIEGNLRIIDCINDVLSKTASRITSATSSSSGAQLLKIIPGVGDYTALMLSSTIDGAERFPDSYSLEPYFGLAHDHPQLCRQDAPRQDYE